MEFTLTFGAVGDFIAVIEVVRSIIVALDDSRGLVKAYRDVVQSLEVLEKTLHLVADLYNEQSPASDTGDLRAIALRCVAQIHLCLQEFSDKIQKFAPSLSNGGTKNVFKDVRRKIQWKLEEGDVDKFRAEVAGYTSSLNMLLELTTARVVQRNHEAAIQQAADTENRTAVMKRNSNQSLKGFFDVIGRRILSRLGFVSRLAIELKSSTAQLISMVLTVSAELSSIRAVIMRLERPVSEEFFLLEDATGKVFPIHLRTITSWEAFEYIIVDRFKGKRGAHRIQRKRYSLQDGATRRAVDRSMDWESTFLPYQKVDMSLMCREAQRATPTKSSTTCPRCLTESPGETGVEVQCQICRIFFTRVVEVDDEVLPDAPTTLSRLARFGQSAFNLTKSTSAKRAREEAESENEQECTCERPKRRKEQETKKRKATCEEPESESDDEDLRGFMRITLISKRERIHGPGLPFSANQTETFDSMAHELLGGLSDATSRLDASFSSPVSQATKGSFGSMPVGPRIQLSGASFQTSRDDAQNEDEDDGPRIDSDDETSELAKPVSDAAAVSDSKRKEPNAAEDDSHSGGPEDSAGEDEYYIEVVGHTYRLPGRRSSRYDYKNYRMQRDTDNNYDYLNSLMVPFPMPDAAMDKSSRRMASSRYTSDDDYPTSDSPFSSKPSPRPSPRHPR
ncbi:hypothetical protein CTA2_12068 [Colletotrichum tanaceti]|uniref:Ubiquitin-like domain-containing protein n=1 Tax=Colletotrichum tanaceti TaxID=1306861 RepID=A0A4U6XBF3_9PEZI|nr:hypothetical protein CTA2_12068 [Colletotrichum tanaceti]TKW52382.1 hypothetical protein CTA1_70 [Colletotrichum tanaceti]